MSSELFIDEIIALEPRVGALLSEAQHEPHATWRDYANYKARMKNLVGFYAEKEPLRSSLAYDVTLKHLTRALRLWSDFDLR